MLVCGTMTDASSTTGGSRLPSDAEREVQEDARAKQSLWSWLVVAIIFGIPAGIFVFLYVFVRASMFAVGQTPGEAVRFGVLGLFLVVVGAWVWTWWERR